MYEHRSSISWRPGLEKSFVAGKLANNSTIAQHDDDDDNDDDDDDVQ